MSNKQSKFDTKTVSVKFSTCDCPHEKCGLMVIYKNKLYSTNTWYRGTYWCIGGREVKFLDPDIIAFRLGTIWEYQTPPIELKKIGNKFLGKYKNIELDIELINKYLYDEVYIDPETGYIGNSSKCMRDLRQDMKRKKLSQELAKNETILAGLEMCISTLDKEMDNPHDCEEFLTLFEAREIAARAVPGLKSWIEDAREVLE